MRIVLFCHSLLSDWNHGNAHFLRGVCTELAERGHDVRIYEPRDAWSVVNLVADHGETALEALRHAYPTLRITRYDEASIDVDEALAGADIVLVHEWNTHAMVRRIGQHRAAGGDYVLLFHDTHHRSVSDAASMAAFDLESYDGVLAFGEIVRQRYERAGWARRAWTWHEAADTRVFRPRSDIARERDLVWIGNWGDEERTAELHEFLVEPVRQLALSADVHGVRYPNQALRSLRDAGIRFRGWLANFRVADAFARHRVTIHVPRRPYTQMLRGIPTIRPFEAMACGIPLISAPWDDEEGLFRAGEDYLVARDSEEMTRALQSVLADPELARSLCEHGRRTIETRHTCAHRVDELLAIVDSVLDSGFGVRDSKNRNLELPDPEARSPNPGSFLPL
jgi:spore maturation protein CgeB